MYGSCWKESTPRPSLHLPSYLPAFLPCLPAFLPCLPAYLPAHPTCIHSIPPSSFYFFKKKKKKEKRKKKKKHADDRFVLAYLSILTPILVSSIDRPFPIPRYPYLVQSTVSTCIYCIYLWMDGRMGCACSRAQTKLYICICCIHIVWSGHENRMCREKRDAK